METPQIIKTLEGLKFEVECNDNIIVAKQYGHLFTIELDEFGNIKEWRVSRD